jgi:hypothetical protein
MSDAQDAKAPYLARHKILNPASGLLSGGEQQMLSNTNLADQGLTILLVEQPWKST